MQSAKCHPQRQISSGWRSFLKGRGWQGSRTKRHDILSVWLCHSHPSFFKKQGATPSRLGWHGYCWAFCPGVRKNRSGRGWLVCPSEPAEPRHEGSFRAIVLWCHQLFPSPELGHQAAFWGTPAPTSLAVTGCPAFCSPLPMAFTCCGFWISSWSSLHHCSSPRSPSVVGSPVPPDSFPVQAADPPSSG